MACLAADAGSDYAITKSSKIKTNESPSSSVRSLGQRRVLSGYVMTDSNIRTAVDAWLSDATAAKAKYGKIKDWDTSGVTDMSHLFCALENGYNCNTAAASFNEDIGAWDTSGVTNMHRMFDSASAFNQNIGGWSVDNVRDMHRMFDSTSAFNQDLGWCVDDGVFDARGWGQTIQNAFYDTLCESTSCGVTEGGCAGWFGSSSQKSNGFGVADDDKMMTLVVLAGLLGLSLAIAAGLFALRQQQQLAAKKTRAPRTFTVTAVQSA